MVMTAVGTMTTKITVVVMTATVALDNKDNSCGDDNSCGKDNKDNRCGLDSCCRKDEGLQWAPTQSRTPPLPATRTGKMGAGGPRPAVL